MSSLLHVINVEALVYSVHTMDQTESDNHNDGSLTFLVNLNTVTSTRK